MKAIVKRTANTLAALIVCTTIAACSEDGAASTGGTDAAGPEQAEAAVDQVSEWSSVELEPLSEPPPSGLKVAALNCMFPACFPGEIEEAGEALGWDLTEVSYDMLKGPSSFVAAMDQALEAKPDAIILLNPYPLDLIEKQVAQASDEGITLVDIGDNVDEPPTGFIACVTCAVALRSYGALTADYAVADAGGATSVGIVGAEDTVVNQTSADGVIAELEEVSPETETHMINVSNARPPEANAATIISELQRNPDIEYLLFQSADLMTGVPQALSGAGLADRVKLIGFAPSDEAQLQLVDGGGVDAWVGTDGPAIWWRAADALARHEAGADFDPVPLPELRLITAGNVEPGMFAPRDYKQAFMEAWGAGS